MKYQKSLKYNILGWKRTVIAFYIIMALVILLSFIGITTVNDGVKSSSINGMEFATLVFIFVIGLNSFKDRMFMMMQNGVSRKTFYLSSITSFVILCFFMSVIDRLIYLLTKLLTNVTDKVKCSGLFEMIYSRKITEMSTITINLEGFLFNLCIYLMVAAVGFFLTISYYLMNKTMKIVISVGVPVGVSFVFPVVDQIADGRISRALGRVIDFAMGISNQNPFSAMVTFLIAFAAFSGLSWLLMKKVTLRSN